MDAHEAKHDSSETNLSNIYTRSASNINTSYADGMQEVTELAEPTGLPEMGAGEAETLGTPSGPKPNVTNQQDSEDSEMPNVSKESLSNMKNASFFSYMYAELTRGYLLEYDEAKFTEKRQRVYEFMKIPREVEKFMTYGFMQCVDAFLYVFTFLPLRFLMALVKLIVKGCFSSCLSIPGRVLEPAQICDLLKGFILVVCCIAINYVDVSMMYHIIRGQAIIKLYIFFNMLEVADRLFSSFGQDILDSLFWTATEPRGRRREHIGLVPHLALAIIYVFLHAILVLFQATTLNVAFNSHNKALLTIMMSNNFVELKGSVFKKFEKNNLFQMSCSDVRERFHFMILLAIVCVRNLTEFSWNIEHLWVLVPDVVMVMGSEFMVDWVKHAFITKFNDIPHEVYREYRISIAYDMATSRHNHAFGDHLDVVSRRMGFIPMPLAVLLVRVVFQSLKITDLMGVVLAVLFYLCLTSFKVLNSIVLLGKASDYIKESHTKTAKSTHPHKPNYDSYKKQHARSPSSPPSDIPQESPASGGERSLPRRHSVGSKLGTVVQSLPDYEPTLAGRPSLTPKLLLSNSTVSLVGLNEEYVKETKSESDSTKTTPPGGSDLKKRMLSKRPQKPLSEIDRYDMCSNRII